MESPFSSWQQYSPSWSYFIPFRFNHPYPSKVAPPKSSFSPVRPVTHESDNEGDARRKRDTWLVYWQKSAASPRANIIHYVLWPNLIFISDSPLPCVYLSVNQLLRTSKLMPTLPPAQIHLVCVALLTQLVLLLLVVVVDWLFTYTYIALTRNKAN